MIEWYVGGEGFGPPGYSVPEGWLSAAQAWLDKYEPDLDILVYEGSAGIFPEAPGDFDATAVKRAVESATDYACNEWRTYDGYPKPKKPRLLWDYVRDGNRDMIEEENT